MKQLFSILLILTVLCSADEKQTRLKMKVNATLFGSERLQVELTMKTKEGLNRFWFPRWIPGIHSVFANIESINGLKVETTDGKNIPWKRNFKHLYQFTFTPPEGTKEVIIKYNYICNKTSMLNSGTDSYLKQNMICINWNTIAFYPDGYDAKNILYDVELKIPEKWPAASALRPKREGGTLTFSNVNLTTLIDSPFIAGPFMKSYKVNKAEPIVHVHIIGEKKEDAIMPDAQLKVITKMVAEAKALFKFEPFKKYDFLILGTTSNLTIISPTLSHCLSFLSLPPKCRLASFLPC